MKPDQPTPEQLDAITLTDRHVLVAAGAGSGKTSTVVNRLLYLLGVPVAGRTIAAPVALERLSAITFTLTAAAGLKRKLRTGLLDAGRRDLAYQVDTARIGTIHAFCGDLLREFALRRGVSPAVTVMEEGAARAAAEEAARDALVAAVESATPGVAELLTRRKQSDIHGAILQLLDQGDRLKRIAGSRLGDEERTLIQLAGAALGLLEARLLERGSVDFDRMLTWSRDLLRDDDYVRRTLQRRIHTLIVDEFQDVDPVQWEIAGLLGSPGSGLAGTPRLLLVGDPKQSIYRFRNADVTTWREAEALFDSGAGKVIPLNDNFRSTAPILDFVAATAGVLLDTPLDPPDRKEFEIAFARLEPGTPEQADGPPVELIAIPPIGGTIEPIREFEAEAIADRAMELHQGGTPWREMAFLLPAWTSAELYQDALRRRKIPTYLLLDEGFYQRREVVDQIMALEAIRAPEDDRALMGFLRSPFVGLRDETLLAIAIQAKRPYWGNLGQVTVQEPERLARGIALLGRAVALRDRIPHDALLDELLQQSGYWAHLALLGEARAQAVANLRKFLLLARGAANGSVGEFLRGIAAQRDRNDRVGDARLHGDRDDVVTISTVHSAKGLEWDVVFWCDLIRDGHGPSTQVLIGRDGIALKDPDAETQSAEWLALAGQIALEDEAEKKRLWYVASTRARKRLILSPFPGPDYTKSTAKSPLNQLKALLAIPAGPGSVVYPRYPEGTWKATVWLAATPPPPASAVRPELPVSDQSVLPPLLAPVEVSAGRQLHSATEALTQSRCETKHWFQYVMGFREPAIRRDTAEFGGAVARGQIVHDVLEQYRLDAELDGLIDDAVRKWDPDAPPPETDEGAGYRQKLRAEVEAVATDPAYREVADLPGAQRELGFVHLTGPDRGWQGGFDLAAPGQDGWVLLDVKTGGDGNLDQKARQYGPQRDVYTRAAEAISGQPVREFRFHFSRAGKQVRHQFDAAERAALAGHLEALADRMESGKPRLTDHPAECGHCGFKRVGWCLGAAD